MPLSRRLLAVVTSASALALAGCQTAPPPPGHPGRFHPARRVGALSVGGRDRRLARARGEDARGENPPAQPGRWRRLYGRSRQRTAPANGRHRPRRAAGRRRDRHPHPGGVHLRCQQRGGRTAFRRDPAGDRADGENPQADLRRRARPHRHHRQPQLNQSCRTSAPPPWRPISLATASPRRGSRRGAMAKPRRSTCPTTPKPSRPATAGSRSAWCPTAASGGLGEEGAKHIARLRPRRSRQARRAGDGRSAGRRCARRG